MHWQVMYSIRNLESGLAFDNMQQQVMLFSIHAKLLLDQLDIHPTEFSIELTKPTNAIPTIKLS